MKKSEKRLINSLKSPHDIQKLLDELPYSADPITRSAGAALSAGKAHCFDGALIAARALEIQGRTPFVMDLQSNGNDDDHVLAVFHVNGHYGAIAKSNFVGLRFREPIYKTLRELALSYFNSYINLARERTLVGYSKLVDLSRVDTVDWRAAPVDQDVYNELARKLDSAQHYRLFSKKVEKQLQKADERLLAGETFGLNMDGVFKPD